MIQKLPHNILLRIRDNIYDLIYFLLRKFLKPIINFLWIRRIVGIENFPLTGSVILAMNHQSYFDFLCLAAIAPRNIHFLAAEKFFDHWLWSRLMIVTRQVRVDRKNSDKVEVHRLVHDHLESNRVIGIFPEGTRSPYEYVMLKAYTGIAKYSLVKKVPIVPIGLRGTFRVMSKHDKKPRIIKAVEIHIGKPIHFAEYHLRNDLTHVDYNVVTSKVMKEISKLSEKDYPHE